MTTVKIMEAVNGIFIDVMENPRIVVDRIRSGRRGPLRSLPNAFTGMRKEHLNMVSPSFILTELNKETDEQVLEESCAKLPLKKFLTPEETAEEVRFLVQCSQLTNGNNIVINQAEDLI